jgi:O-antigen ligase
MHYRPIKALARSALSDASNCLARRVSAFLAMKQPPCAWSRRSRRVADCLAVATAAALPWSTSATGILIALWAVAFVPTIEWADLEPDYMGLSATFPFVLFLLAVAGMAWADVAMTESVKAVASFSKLLVMVVLMAQFRRTRSTQLIFATFLVSCMVLLVVSFAVTVWPISARSELFRGIPVKDYIIQSLEFIACAAVLLPLAIARFQASRWATSAGIAILACAFFANVFFIITSRTTMVILPALMLTYGAWRFGWKGLFGAVAAGLVLASILWVISPYSRERAMHLIKEVEMYEANQSITSAGERIVYWTKSLNIIGQAPILGHGTGSIAESFRRAAVGQLGIRAEVTSNPHNQTFAIAIQLGVVGAVILWAMWICHFILFFQRRSLYAWIGLVVVVQNVVGSLFNSFLFDFTEGWIYVFGVSAAAAMSRGEKSFGANSK